MRSFILFMLIGASFALDAPADRFRFARPLSYKASKIYQKVYETVIAHPEESGVPSGLIGVSGRFKDHVLDYGDNPTHCKKLIYTAMMQAQEEILLTTFFYDRNSPCAKLVKKALVDLNRDLMFTGRKIRVYMVISTISLLSFWKKPEINFPSIGNIMNTLKVADPSQFDLPYESELPNLDFKVKTYHLFSVGTIHSKLLVVDGRILVMGSKNIDEFEGMEYATWAEGSVAYAAREDFRDAWGELLPVPPSDAQFTSLRNDFPILYLPRTSNHHLFDYLENNPQDQAWLTALDLANVDVFIYTPSFNCKTIFNKVLETVRRGVDVTIVTNYKYEDFAQRFYPDNVGTNIKTVKKLYQALEKEPNAVRHLNVCYFIGKRVQPPKPSKEESSHVKFMSVDDEFYIFGSGNMDGQSWHHSREVNLLVDSPQMTMQMKELMLSNQQSLDHCFRDKEGKVDLSLLQDAPGDDGSENEGEEAERRKD